jgi:hypothetical protein
MEAHHEEGINTRSLSREESDCQSAEHRGQAVRVYREILIKDGQCVRPERSQPADAAAAC